MKKEVFDYEGKNPLYKFEAYLINRFGHSNAGLLGYITGLIIGSAVGIGLFVLIMKIF